MSAFYCFLTSCGKPIANTSSDGVGTSPSESIAESSNVSASSANTSNNSDSNHVKPLTSSEIGELRERGYEIVVSEEKELQETQLKFDDEYARINQNATVGSFLYPYNGGDYVNSAGSNYSLLFIDKNGNRKEINGTRSFELEYIKNNNFYGVMPYKGMTERADEYLVKFKDGKATQFFDCTFGEPYYYYGDTIYCDFGDSIKSIGYNGKGNKILAAADNYGFTDFIIYKNKIWFTFQFDTGPHLGCMDMNGGNKKIFSNIHALTVRANNDWIYYLESNGTKDILSRINATSYSCEKVSNIAMNFFTDHYNFTDHYILFSAQNTLYRVNHTEEKEIYKCEGSKIINGIRTEATGEIYIDVSDNNERKCYQIDIDGNILKTIL